MGVRAWEIRLEVLEANVCHKKTGIYIDHGGKNRICCGEEVESAFHHVGIEGIVLLDIAVSLGNIVAHPYRWLHAQRETVSLQGG